MKTPVIEVKDLAKKFVVGKVPIWPLKKVNLKVDAGEFVVINGPSGCGKTTLLNMIASLDNYDSGEILIRGENIKNLKQSEVFKFRRSSIGMVFQNFNLIGSLTAKENVALPLAFAGIKKRDRYKRAMELLEMVGLKDRANHYPSELSGGQQQKVGIARALSANPWILLVDEPTGNLDSKSSLEIMSLLSDLNKKFNRTILLVTHDARFFNLADRVLSMEDGEIVAEKKVADVDRFKAEESDVKYFIPPHLGNGMRVVDVVMLAYKHFRHARTRTMLTIWGMVIGISAIILLISLGFGLQKITVSQLASMDSLQTITVVAPDKTRISEAQVSQIRDIANVAQVSPELSLVSTGTLGPSSTALILKGVALENLDLEQISVTAGAKFSSNSASEAIVSQTALKNFDIADGSSMIGKNISLVIVDQMTAADPTIPVKTQTINAKIVGTTGEKLGPEVELPIGLLSQNFQGYSGATVKVVDLKKINETKTAIDSLGLQTSAISDLVGQIDKAFLIIQIILGLFGSIALLVASFGIVNTMTISLLERTHEIGIMKALGITLKDIRRIFSYEAILFGVFGGALGILWGWLCGQGLNLIVLALMKQTGQTGALTPFITPYKFAILVFIFAIAIAWLAGLYPARRAAKLSPLEALRYE